MIYPFPVSIVANAGSAGGGASFPWQMDGATWAGRGDDYMDTNDASPGIVNGVRRWNNLVDGGSIQVEQTADAFAPTIVRIDAEISGVHMGAAASLDDWDEGSSFDNYIAEDAWHCFIVVNFDDITDAGGTLGHYIFGGCNSGGQPSAVTTAPWGVFLKEISGQDYAVGYMYNGTTTFSVSASITTDQYVLIEFYADGSTMGIRTDDGAASEVGFTGTISSLGTRVPKAGSKNFNGSWQISTNRMFEIAVANQKNDSVGNIRTYFSNRYGMSV